MDDLKNMIGEIVNDVTNVYRASKGLAPINAAGQTVEGQTTAMADEPGNPEPGSVPAAHLLMDCRPVPSERGEREGWVSVPAEPTDRMCIAGAYRISFEDCVASEVYKAMLAAIPKTNE